MAIRSVWLTLLIATAPSSGLLAQAGPKQRVTIEDMIRMTTISGDDTWDEGVARPVMFSHDGSRFVFLIERADLENNTNVSSVILFRTKDLFANPTPDTVVTLTSSSSRPAINRVQWLPGDTALMFIGEHPGETAQLWVLSLPSRALRRLSASRLSVTSYDLAPVGDRMFFTSYQAPDSAKNESRAARGFVVTQEIRDLLGGAWDVSPDQDEAHDNFITSLKGGDLRKVSIEAIGDCYGSLRFSPDGRYALNRCIRRDNLADWMAYIDPKVARWRYGFVDVLIDLDRATAKRLLDLPALGGQAEWSPDGSRILIPNSLLPTSVAPPPAGTVSRATVAIDPATGALSIVTTQDSLAFLRWSADGKTVVLRSTRSDSLDLAFREGPNGWAPVDSKSVPPVTAVPSNDGLEVFVEEDLNTRPRLVATQAGRRAILFDPNPWLTRLELAREEVFKWKTQDGEWTGGLYYPVGYTPGKRYPLVIQTHGFAPDKFQMAGYGITGYAGQALAAHGIMVLQIGDGPIDVMRKSISTGEENPFNQRGFEAAIDTLDRLGLIDRNRVALEGWSRTTLHVRHMLANSSYPIVAALISDGFDASYVRWVIDPPAHGEIESIGGGAPIGDQLELFQERIPTMQAERFKAPVRIESIAYPGGGGPLTQWELYQILRRLDKPVELVYYPRGEHSLRMPWERLTSQGGALDWFRFWLAGDEDSSPSKADQYRRWRGMRDVLNAKR